MIRIPRVPALLALALAASPAPAQPTDVTSSYTASGTTRPQRDAFAIVNCPSDCTLTVPNGGTSGFQVHYQNTGATTVTISARINGASGTIALPGGGNGSGADLAWIPGTRTYHATQSGSSLATTDAGGLSSYSTCQGSGSVTLHYDPNYVNTSGPNGRFYSVADTSCAAPATASFASQPSTTGTQGVALASGGTATCVGITTAYAVLYTGSADEGSRTSFGCTTGSTAPALTPASTGTYMYKIYAVATGGAALATSGAITVSASSSPNLAMTSPTWDSSGQYAGSGALSGGFGAWTSGLGSAPVLRISFRFKAAAAPSGNNAIILRTSDGAFGLILAQSTCGLILNFESGAHTSEGGSVCDGAYHYVTVDRYANGDTHVYKDGGFQGGATDTVAMPSGAVFQFRAAGAPSSSAGPYTGAGLGEIDEIHATDNPVFSNFTPPTGAESRGSHTLGLWHLDGSGTGS